MGGAKKPRPEQPERPACPWQFEHLWRWFHEVLSGCAPSGMGPVTISWRDVLAWCELTGETPAPFEVRLLLRLSVLRANIEGESARKDRPDRPMGGHHGQRNAGAGGPVKGGR